MLSSTSPEVTWRSSIELADPYGPNPENPPSPGKLPSPPMPTAPAPPSGLPPSPRPPPPTVYDSSPMAEVPPSPPGGAEPGSPGAPVPGGASTAPSSPAAKLEMVPRNRFQWYWVIWNRSGELA